MKHPPAELRAVEGAAGRRLEWTSAAALHYRQLKNLLGQARKRWPWVVASGVFSAVTTLLALLWWAAFEVPEVIPQDQSSRVLAEDGRLVATIHGEQDRTLVELHEISRHLRTAVLISEDREFYEHSGMSYRGILRAAFTNVASGGIRQGGSTITQQYARNIFPSVGRQRTLPRKLKETFWAIRLEYQLSKDQIMEGYLNTVYFGRGAYGAQAAARTYFGVPASELTPGQATYLAGIIRGPELFQIEENPEAATALRDRVVDDLVKAYAVSEEEGEIIKQEDLAEQIVPIASMGPKSPRAGYFVEHVRLTLKKQYGLSDNQILREGLTVHTTLNLDMQDAAEAAFRQVLPDPDDPEAALVAMGPQGEVRAMVGGRDVDSVGRARGFNFATGGSQGGGRQAGSAFKPFALAAFLSEGNSLSSTFPGRSPIEIGSRRCRNEDGSPWKVANFEDVSFGSLDVAGATLSSVNTVYAQMMANAVTPAELIQAAGKAGIEVPTFDTGCALALGTSDVTPLQLARAYTTFAQRGNRPEPLMILKITRSDGTVIAEASPRVEQALERNVADSINYILERNVRVGTGTAARIGRPAAGKTGTTQNHQNAWFAGYTPDLTAVVWMGYPPDADGTIPNMTNVRGRPVTGGSLPAVIWRHFMTRALRGVESSSFPRPVLDGRVLNYAPTESANGDSAGDDPENHDSQEADRRMQEEPSDDHGPPGAQDAQPGTAPTNPPPAASQPSRPRTNPPPPPAPTEFEPCFPFCD